MGYVLAAAVPVAHPHRGDLLDLVLVAAAVIAAIAGFRRGFLVGLLSFVGFAGGAILGSRFASAVAQALVGGTGSSDVGAQHALGQRVVALVTVLVVAVVGQTVLVAIGVRLRRLLWATPLGLVDATGGAVLELAAFLLVAWVIASAIAVAPLPSARSEVRRSLVLSAINQAVPSVVRSWVADLERLLQQHALPALTSPFGAAPVLPPGLAPPDAGTVPAAIRAAGPDILKITGTASCNRVQEGSGFVISPQHVLTNAHVVAGVGHPTVALPGPGAVVLNARVVLYDPNRDVAILYVPGLTRSALRFAGTAAFGASAVVAGYPENGPLTAVPARVAGEQDVTGPNIYANRTVTRAVYTVQARVLPGNSGGPLLTPDGAVYGVVFAASVDYPDTGYALTAGEVSGDASLGAHATTPVSTQGCD